MGLGALLVVCFVFALVSCFCVFGLLVTCGGLCFDFGFWWVWIVVC